MTTVVGIDLSGPSNTTDTVLTVFNRGRMGIRYCGEILAATDGGIRAEIARRAVAGDVVVGIDAPLSYHPGGGDRPGDRDLRTRTIAAGMHPGSVMVPTMNRMVYLTLRGIVIARDLAAIPGVRVVEVHPGAACALRGAPTADVRAFSRNREARARLVEWMAKQGLSDLPTDPLSSHHVAACAAALAAWQWAEGRSVWLHQARPPDAPFDFAC